MPKTQTHRAKGRFFSRSLSLKNNKRDSHIMRDMNITIYIYIYHHVGIVFLIDKILY
jgi:hypothetical protein